MENTKYLDHTFTVSSYEMDAWGYLTPTAILNICQESAYMHSSALGFGFETLLAQGMAWVLSRVRVEVDRSPVWREKIRVRTWHKGSSGIFALRDYIFYDAEDKPIIRVTTSWIIINIASRRPQRADRIFAGNDSFSLHIYEHEALSAEAEKVDAKDMCEILSDHYVSYSDLDVNHHVNNAKYMEWLCDRSPQQMKGDRTLKSFCVNYNHEAKRGDVVSLGGSNMYADEVIFSGEVDGKSVFTAKLNYATR